MPELAYSHRVESTGLGQAIALVNASRTYRGQGPPVVAVRNTDLNIETGSYTAIVGPSGAGKSTLLNLLGLLDRPDTGDVLVCGRATASMSNAALTALRSAHLAFVFQAFHLLGGRSALQNVTLGMTYQGVPAGERMQRARAALDQVQLGARAGHDVARLSGGERQRVAIARAIAAGAPILLCDEPTGNLDQQNGRGILQVLHELNAAGTTIVAVTHDPEVARQAHRRLEVQDGFVRDA